jgi:hypothetical protein
MKSLSVKLPNPCAHWLEERSKKLGRTQSDLVRQVLEEQRRAAHSPNEKSCGARLKELGGFFAGSADLSTNPKYLKSLGK